MKKYGILLAFLAITSWSNATIYYLKSTTGSPNAWNDKDAANVVTDDINAALDKLTTEGDELWIAQGTYTLSRYKNFNAAGNLKIYGGFKGEETDASLRELSGSNPWDFKNKTVITLSDAFTGAASLLAAVYLNASAIVLDGVSFESCVADTNYASLIRCTSNCVGGIIRNCRFLDNTVVGYGCIRLESSVTVQDCYFMGNKINNKDQAACIYAQGSQDKIAVIRNCLFDGNDNTATTTGALSVRAQNYANVMGCEFRNHASNANASHYTIYTNGEQVSIDNCSFHDNTKGRCVMLNGGTLTKCIMYNCNTSTYPLLLNKGEATNNVIMASYSAVTPVSFGGNTNSKNFVSNVVIGSKISAKGAYKDANAEPLVVKTSNITVSNNMCYLKNGIETGTEEENTTFSVTIDSNPTITNGTQLTLSDYGPTVWPAEAWAALKTALGSVTPTFALEDGKSFYYTGEEVLNPVSYTRSCYIDGYRESIILPFKPTVILNASDEPAKDDFIFERYVSQSATEITFAKCDFANLEANVPYLMRYTGLNKGDKAYYTFQGEGLPARPASLGEIFVGTYEKVPYSATRYVLAVDNDNKEYFGRLADDDEVSIAPYHAYLELSAAPSAPARFSIAFGGSDEGGATGIEPAAQSDGLWGEEGAICLSVGQAQQVRIYGVDGRLVRTEWVDGQARLPMPQGLYLVNNRKVVVR